MTSSDELIAFAAEHISYEVEMAANGAAMWRDARAYLSRVVSSSLTVAVLVHLRLLDDFLSRTKRHRDDVLAVDYLDNWQPPDPSPLATTQDRDAVNGQVAHLALRRETGRLWNLADLAKAVLTECQRFFDQVEVEASAYVSAFEVPARITREFLHWHEHGLDLDPHVYTSVEVDGTLGPSPDLIWTTDVATRSFVFPSDVWRGS